MRGWDARTVSDRLEGAVGRDLQYIRINGTLVGGLVGLVIHSDRGADMSEADEALRELAANRGCKLVKSRVRTPGRRRLRQIRAQGREDRQGGVRLRQARPHRDRPSEIEDFLRGDAAATWKSSVGKAPARKAEAEARAEAEAGAEAASSATPGPAIGEAIAALIRALGYEVGAADVRKRLAALKQGGDAAWSRIGRA